MLVLTLMYKIVPILNGIYSNNTWEMRISVRCLYCIAGLPRAVGRISQFLAYNYLYPKGKHPSKFQPIRPSRFWGARKQTNKHSSADWRTYCWFIGFILVQALAGLSICILIISNIFNEKRRRPFCSKAFPKDVLWCKDAWLIRVQSIDLLTKHREDRWPTPHKIHHIVTHT